MAQRKLIPRLILTAAFAMLTLGTVVAGDVAICGSPHVSPHCVLGSPAPETLVITKKSPKT